MGLKKQETKHEKQRKTAPSYSGLAAAAGDMTIESLAPSGDGWKNIAQRHPIVCAQRGQRRRRQSPHVDYHSWGGWTAAGKAWKPWTPTRGAVTMRVSEWLTVEDWSTALKKASAASGGAADQAADQAADH
ncbi:hypothetical protein CKAH01_00490 [Colletotrichum kahawae]|uniref:Uncharacterized protein n=1 Tax=Colletotrichum kahawae TaxID=34407 RepID=A0AAD9YV90_COLKA|nr:hypothetical protein CKAH01_00490 [Colletotrichum kahawae]